MTDKKLSKEEIRELVRRSREFYEEAQTDLGEPVEEISDILILVYNAQAVIDTIGAEVEWSKYKETWFGELREIIQAIDQLKSE